MTRRCAAARSWSSVRWSKSFGTPRRSPSSSPPESPPPIARFYYNRLSIIDERAGRVNRCLISCQSSAAAAAAGCGRLSINNFAPTVFARAFRTDLRRRSPTIGARSATILFVIFKTHRRVCSRRTKQRSTSRTGENRLRRSYFLVSTGCCPLRAVRA